MLGLAFDGGDEDSTGFPSFPPNVFDDEGPSALATETPLPPVGDSPNGALDLSEVVDGQVPDSALFEFWSNGSADGLRTTTGLPFKPVVVTPQRRREFLETTNYAPSSHFHSLPFVWQMKQKKAHYVGDIVYGVTVTAEEMGFRSPIPYVRSRGWVYKVKGKGTSLKYKRLSQVEFERSPSNYYHFHFKAMVKKLYDVIKRDGKKDIYKGLDMVRFLEQASFEGRLHRYAQQFHFGVLIVDWFFIPHATTHNDPTSEDDILYWFKRLFVHCRRSKDYLLLINNINSLFHGLDGDCQKELATDLMTNYGDCIRDEVNRRANRVEHQLQYQLRLEESLKEIQRGSRSNVGTRKELLFACCKARDMTYVFLSDEEKERFHSSTRESKEDGSGKAGVGRKKRADGE